MITTLIPVFVVGLILYIVHCVVGPFIKRQPRNIIGLMLGLIFLLYALRAFNVVSI
jgi:hypothetical protein